MKQKESIFTTKAGEDISFEDLLSTIYQNSVDKQKNMIETVNHIKPMLQSVQDAVTLLPMLTQLQKVSVENDDALIKLAAIIQKGLKGKVELNEAGQFSLTEEDRRALLEQAAREVIPGGSRN